MAKRANKFNKVAKRIEEIKENAGGFVTLTEDDNYDALIVGVIYREDVISEYEGIEKVQDKIAYIFAVPTDDGIATIQKEFTVSAYDQAKINELLIKFDIELEEFYTIVGQTVRISVSIKKSKKGNEYPAIDKILMAKKGTKDIVLDEALGLPSWYGEDANEELVDLIDGVSIKEEEEAPKTKKRKKVKTVVVEDEDVEDVEEDEFFDDLEDDDDED